jgi:hypothetical protein
MNDETCKCFECNVEIAPNMGFLVSRPSPWTGKVFYMDLCDDCWFNEGKEETEE